MKIRSLIAMTFLLSSCLINDQEGKVAFVDSSIVNGQELESDERESSLFIEIRNNSSCSGTFIKKDLILTAAHCLVGAKVGHLKIRYKKKILKIDSFSFPTQFLYGDTARDFGYIKLKEEVEIDDEKIPEVIGANYFLLEDFENKKLELVAFGKSESSRSIGKKQSGFSKLISFNDRELLLVDNASACSGDSGGSIFDGKYLIGLITSGQESCEYVTGGIRIDFALNWVHSDLAIKKALEDQDYELALNLALAVDNLNYSELLNESFELSRILERLKSIDLLQKMVLADNFISKREMTKLEMSFQDNPRVFSDLRIYLAINYDELNEFEKAREHLFDVINQGQIFYRAYAYFALYELHVKRKYLKEAEHFLLQAQYLYPHEEAFQVNLR